MTVIPLAQGRFLRANPQLQIDGSDLVVDLRRVFAGAPWRVPLGQVAVVTPSQVGPIALTGQGFASDPYVPAIDTHEPTLQLLFRQPVQAPSQRLAGSGSPADYWRFRHGCAVDGLRLNAADPDAAFAALQAAGAEVADAPTRWLRGHRELTHDLQKLVQLNRRRRTSRTVSILGSAGTMLLVAAAATGVHSTWFWAFAGGALASMLLPGTLVAAMKRRNGDARREV